VSAARDHRRRRICHRSGKLFSEIVRKLRNPLRKFRSAENRWTSSAGRAKRSLQCVETYGRVSEMRFTGETFTVKMDHTDCRDMINQDRVRQREDDSNRF
jgi:hypothetical protein